MRLVVVTASLAERDAVLRDLGPVRPARLAPYPETRVASTGAGTIVVVSAGGAPASTAAAAVAINRVQPDAALSMGLATGLDPAAAVGSAVLADTIALAGLPAPGADGATGRSGDPAPWAAPAYVVPPAVLAPARQRAATAGVALHVGTLLTLPVPFSGDGGAGSAALAGRRHPGALAAAADGYGVVAAGQAHRVPVLELRAVAATAGGDGSAPGRRPDVGPTPPDPQDSQALDVLARVAAALFARDWGATAPAG